MEIKPIYIATEDFLSEVVAERLVKEADTGLQIAVRVRGNGFSYLKTKFAGLAKTAKKIPVFLITDLDRAGCPIELLNDWSKGNSWPEGLIARVAVREVESWLLADRQGFSKFSGIPANKITVDPESLYDPKQELLNLVKRFGNKNIKSSLLPRRGSSAKIGLEYNLVLCSFVRDSWSVSDALLRSESLNRALSRLKTL